MRVARTKRRTTNTGHEGQEAGNARTLGIEGLKCLCSSRPARCPSKPRRKNFNAKTRRRKAAGKADGSIRAIRGWQTAGRLQQSRTNYLNRPPPSGAAARCSGLLGVRSVPIPTDSRPKVAHRPRAAEAGTGPGRQRNEGQGNETCPARFPCPHSFVARRFMARCLRPPNDSSSATRPTGRHDC